MDIFGARRKPLVPKKLAVHGLSISFHILRAPTLHLVNYSLIIHHTCERLCQKQEISVVREEITGMHCAYDLQTTHCTVLAAYILGPSRGKGFNSLNSVVLYLRTSSMMHCDLRFSDCNFSHPVASSTEFGEVTFQFRPSHLPWWRAAPYTTFCTPLALVVAGIHSQLRARSFGINPE